MYDFIMQYLPYIAQGTVILGAVVPFLRARVVQDKNIISVFGNIKDLASKVGIKEADITSSISKINNIATIINDKVDKKIAELDAKIVEINKSIVNFQQSELYQRMLTGLEGLNQLENMLQNKDTTIQDIGVILKELKAEIIALQQQQKV